MGQYKENRDRDLWNMHGDTNRGQETQGMHTQAFSN
jgi:hypothetical protein